MKTYDHVIAYVTGSIWAIEMGKWHQIMAALDRVAAGEEIPAEEIAAIVAARPRRAAPMTGSIAVLPLFGTISNRAGGMEEASGGTSTESFGAAFQQAMNDPSVSAVVLDVESPGGVVAGVEELATRIHAARGPKPIVAVAGLAASAAYWIATAADELVVTPSGDVGGIGVFTGHQDRSKMMDRLGVSTTLISAGKFKTEGHPFAPLGDEARAAVQERVDDIYANFTAAVARHRGVRASTVRGGFGEGRVVSAQKAVALGMADRVGTLEGTIQRIAGGQWSRPMRADAAAFPVFGDVDEPTVLREDVAAEVLRGPSTEARRRRLRLVGG